MFTIEEQIDHTFDEYWAELQDGEDSSNYAQLLGTEQKIKALLDAANTYDPDIRAKYPKGWHNRMGSLDEEAEFLLEEIGKAMESIPAETANVSVALAIRFPDDFGDREFNEDDFRSVSLHEDITGEKEAGKYFRETYFAGGETDDLDPDKETDEDLYTLLSERGMADLTPYGLLDMTQADPVKFGIV